MAKKIKTKIESLDGIDEIDDNGFIEGDVPMGAVLTSFSFTSEPAPASPPAPAKSFTFNDAKPTADALTDNRKIKTEPNIATPPIEGEPYTVGRYYKLRYSTAKMLNEIKASHPDVNVYMNTLVDEAIRHYYSFVFKKD
jgi:hypothetical protein